MAEDKLHNISITVAGSTIEKWTDYQIENDMLKPADNFHMQIRHPDWRTWSQCRPDNHVKVAIDGNTCLTGFIDENHLEDDEEGGSTLYISGRDRGGRLVDESAKIESYKGLDLRTVAMKLVRPWFPDVAFSNDINRDALLGLNDRLKHAFANHSSRAGHRARTRHSKSSKPTYPNLDYDGEEKLSRKKVMPGERRWQVLRTILQEVGMLGWSSADGQQFIIGHPDYKQDISFTFIRPAEGDPRNQIGAVLASSYKLSTADRYSAIIAVGMGAGEAHVRCHGKALNWIGEKDGSGIEFSEAKRLIVVDDHLRTNDSARVRAKREMAERDASGEHLQLHVRGHGQGGLFFAPDTIASWEDQKFNIRGNFLITSVTFEHSESRGETTMLKMVPVGTVLRI